MDIIKAEKWEEKLESIAQALFSLNAGQYLFREFVNIINANPLLVNDNYFIGWIKENYYIAAALGIRRQVDMHEDCVSLIKLLKRPRRPRLNGKVERSHRIDNDEFYRMLDGVVIDDSARLPGIRAMPIGSNRHSRTILLVIADTRAGRYFSFSGA